MNNERCGCGALVTNEGCSDLLTHCSWLVRCIEQKNDELAELRAEVARLRKTLYLAIRNAAYKSRKDSPLWVVASHVTSHGSTVSGEICRELGIDPHQSVKDFLRTPYAWPTEGEQPLPPPPTEDKA